MRKYMVLTACLLCACLTACGNAPAADSSQTPAATQAPAETTHAIAETTQPTADTTQPLETEPAPIATGDDVITPDAVGFEGMDPVGADALKEGTYSIDVDSSSSMFRITECQLIVANGKMAAVMTMSGTGYSYVFMGTPEEAVSAEQESYIASVAVGDLHTFTVPVEALNKEIDCAAFSKKKEQWYARTLVFRADSLPDEAFGDVQKVTAESLGLADGEYTVDVRLEGGSGKASVQSPAKLTVAGGKATAEIIWSSNKYDYMVVGDEKILPVSTEEFSVFEIPVAAFDYALKVSADTTAMSTPHEIAYTLYFDSASIK